MRYILTMLIVSVSGFLPLLPMMSLFHFIVIKKDRKNGVKTSMPHILAIYIFCLVLCLILSVTSIPSVYHFSFDMAVNLTPFFGVSTNFIEYVLNIILFVPIGFLLPMLWRKFEKWYITFIYGLLFSLFIEIIQLFNNRITDIDDLLTNTVGTIIGFFLFMLVKRAIPKITVFVIDRASYWKWEPYLCFCFSWLSMLVFKHFISSWFLGSAIIK